MKQSKSLGRNAGMKTVLSMGGDMFSETHAETNDLFQRTQSRLSAKTTKNNIPIQAMMEDQMKLYFNKARPKYGIKNYHVADNMNKEPYFKIQKIAFSKHDKPKDHFLDAHCKIHGPKPAPGKYRTEYKWDELLTKSFKTRGHFYKEPKITFTQSIMDESKKDHRKAAPNTYFKEGQGLRVIGGNLKRARPSVSTSEKSCAHIEAAKWHGQQTGFGFKYNVSYKIPDANEKMARMWKESEKSTDKRIDKIVKDKTKPAPGDYDCSKAFR